MADAGGAGFSSAMNEKSVQATSTPASEIAALKMILELLERNARLERIIESLKKLIFSQLKNHYEGQADENA